MTNASVMMLVKSEEMLTTVIRRNLRAVGNDPAYASSQLHSSDRTASSASEQGLNSQGIATLFVMIAVLTIIILFCCFSAPGIRSLCKRYIFRSCRYDDPDRDNVYTRRYNGPAAHSLSEVITDSPKKERNSVELATQDAQTHQQAHQL